MTWSCSRSGKAVDLLAPQVDQVDLQDMCMALGQINRFSGHARRPYSVAEHSLLVADLLPPSLRLAGLTHDLSEAYLGDVPGPIKHACPGYQEIERRMHGVICRYLDIGPEIPEAVHMADKQALLIELDALMPKLPRAFKPVEKHPHHEAYVGILDCHWGFSGAGHWGRELARELGRALGDLP